MPEAWSRLLQSSNITKQEQKNNPQAVIDAITTFYDQQPKEQSNTKYMTKATTTTTHSGSSLSRVSSSSPSSTTPTDGESGIHIYHSPAHAPSSEIEEDVPPPPIASRPERTKSIYTKPVDDANPTPPHGLSPAHGASQTAHLHALGANSNGGAAPQQAPGAPALDRNKNQQGSEMSRAASEKRKKKMSDEEILEKLRSIVSVGDPTRKYVKLEKIGQG